MQMDTFKRVVANMMARYGTTGQVLVASTGEGTYDVETSEYVSEPPLVFDVKLMVFDYTLQSNGNQVIPHSMVETGDKQIFIQPLSNMPKLQPDKDFILVGTTKYSIVTYKEVNPNLNENILIELKVKEVGRD